MSENESPSNFECILPWEVIETCCSLKPKASTYFLSVNKETQTETKLYVSKLEDHSIKIKIAISNINENEENDKSKEDDTEKDGRDEEKEMSQEVKEGEEEEDKQSPNDPQIEELDLEGEGFNNGFLDGLSTVIIVKKVDTNGEEGRETQEGREETLDSKSDSSSDFGNSKMKNSILSLLNKSSNDEEGVGGNVSCDLCFQNFESPLNLVKHIRKQHRDCTFVRNYLDELKGLSSLSCPICKRNFTAKSSLEAHVKVSHGGLLISPHTKLSLIKREQLTYSKMYNQQYIDQVSSKTPSDKLPCKPVTSPKPVNNQSKEGTRGGEIVITRETERPVLNKSEDEEEKEKEEEFRKKKGKVACDVCNELFETRQEAMRHQDKVHRPRGEGDSREGLPYNCNYCDKVYNSKQLLLKHCLNTHFRSIEELTLKRRRRKRMMGRRGVEEEDEDEEVEVESDDSDNLSEFDSEEEGGEGRTRGPHELRKSKRTSQRNKQNKQIQHGLHSTQSRSEASGNSSPGNKLYFHDNQNSPPSFTCELCGLDFSRMTLLITHSRYCRLKQNS